MTLMKELATLSREELLSFARGIIGICSHSDDFNVFREASTIIENGCIEHANKEYKKDVELACDLLVKEIERTRKELIRYLEKN